VEGDISEVEAEVLKRGTTSVTVSVKAAHAITKKEIFHTEAVLVNAKNGRSIPIGNT
jgi:acyl-CoA hydrolase